MNIQPTTSDSAATLALTALYCEVLVPLDGPLSLDPDTGVTVEIKVWQTRLRLSYIHCPVEQRSRGKATQTLERITEIADRYGVSITAGVQPDVVQRGLNKKELFRWYAKHRFERVPELENEIIRVPKPPKFANGGLTDDQVVAAAYCPYCRAEVGKPCWKDPARRELSKEPHTSRKQNALIFREIREKREREEQYA